MHDCLPIILIHFAFREFLHSFPPHTTVAHVYKARYRQAVDWRRRRRKFFFEIIIVITTPSNTHEFMKNIFFNWGCVISRWSHIMTPMEATDEAGGRNDCHGLIFILFLRIFRSHLHFLNPISKNVTLSVSGKWLCLINQQDHSNIELQCMHFQSLLCLSPLQSHLKFNAERKSHSVNWKCKHFSSSMCFISREQPRTH